MSKKVAEFDIDISPNLVNDSIDELFGFSTEEEVEDPVDAEEPEEEEVEDPEEDDTESSEEGESQEEVVKKTKSNTSKNEDTPEDEEDSLDNPYAGYSNVSLLALALKEQSSDLVSVDIKKDMTPKELLETIEASIEKTLSEKTQEIEDKYDQAANYIKLLVEGGNIETVKQGLKLREISDIELDDDTSEEDLEYIVTQGLLQKGMEPDEAKDHVEALKDKGKLYDRAEKTIETFKKLEQTFIEDSIKRRKQEEILRKQVEEEKRQKVQEIINKGVVRGIPVKDKKKLLDMIFNNTEVVKRIDPNTGKEVARKVPLYSIKYDAFLDNLEQQVAFAQLLLDDFDFTDLVKVAKKSVNEEILKALDKKPTKANESRYTNPWHNL